jgi:hypothetical protein
MNSSSNVVLFPGHSKPAETNPTIAQLDAALIAVAVARQFVGKLEAETDQALMALVLRNRQDVDRMVAENAAAKETLAQALFLLVSAEALMQGSFARILADDKPAG